MSIFCLLWVPFFYILRRIIVGESSSSGSILALLLGSIAAIVQFFLGDFIKPGGFGFNRWLFGFVDLICVQALLPVLAYLIIFAVRRFSGNADFGSFSLLWLIPAGGLRAVSWSALNDPVLLALVPLLWTAIAAGISFFINWMITGRRWYIFVVSIPCILILPVIAAASYWAFFSQQTLLGFALLTASFIPLAASFIFERYHN